MSMLELSNWAAWSSGSEYGSGELGTHLRRKQGGQSIDRALGERTAHREASVRQTEVHVLKPRLAESCAMALAGVDRQVILVLDAVAGDVIPADLRNYLEIERT